MAARTETSSALEQMAISGGAISGATEVVLSEIERCADPGCTLQQTLSDRLIFITLYYTHVHLKLLEQVPSAAQGLCCH